MEIQEIKKTIKELKNELAKLESNTEILTNLDSSFSNAKSRKDLNFESLHKSNEKINRIKTEIAFFEEKAEIYRVTTEPEKRKQTYISQISDLSELINNFCIKVQSYLDGTNKGLNKPNFDTLFNYLNKAREVYIDYIQDISIGAFGNQYNESLKENFLNGIRPFIITLENDGIKTQFNIFEFISLFPSFMELQKQQFQKAFKNVDFSRNLKPEPKE